MTATEPVDLSGDLFELHPNGFATVAWDGPGGRVLETLRRPVLEELTEVVELVALADDTVNAADPDERRRLLTSPESPHAAAFARALAMLTSHDFQVGKLPSWAALPATVGGLVEHWRSVPLPRGMPAPSNGAATASNVTVPSTVRAARSGKGAAGA